MSDVKARFQKVPCNETFDFAIDQLVDFARRDGKAANLSLARLEQLAEALKTDHAFKIKHCLPRFEQCAGQMRKSISKRPRLNILGRILAQPFEHLLKNDPPLMASGQLNNFFHAIETMLGHEAFDNMSERAVKLMEEVAQDKGDSFTYEDLYSQRECWEIQWDSYIVMAGFFSKFSLRKDWFIRFMQSDPNTPGQGRGAFEYNELQFKIQMMCLFDDFKNFSDQAREAFEKRYSKQERKNLSTFFANIAAIEAQG